MAEGMLRTHFTRQWPTKFYYHYQYQVWFPPEAEFASAKQIDLYVSNTHFGEECCAEMLADNRMRLTVVSHNIGGKQLSLNRATNLQKKLKQNTTFASCGTC